MKNIASFGLIVITLLACQNVELPNPENTPSANTCGVDDPLELPWLKERIQRSKDPSLRGACSTGPIGSVTQGSYQGQTVYILHGSEPLPIQCHVCSSTAVDCAGEFVFLCNSEEFAKISDKKLLIVR